MEQNLEQALAGTEVDAAAALKAVENVKGSLRRFSAAAKAGKLRELQSAIEAAEKAMAGLRQQFANAKDGWSFDEEGYFGNGLYTEEIVTAGKRAGVQIFERDDRLINEWDLRRLYPNYRPELEVAEIRQNYEEDLELETPLEEDAG